MKKGPIEITLVFIGIAFLFFALVFILKNNFYEKTITGNVVADSDSIKIYVAVEGNDANAGSKEKPIKTFDRAQELIDVNANKDYEIILRHGLYRKLDMQPWGPSGWGLWNVSIPGHRITIRAMENEIVFIDGEKLAYPNSFEGMVFLEIPGSNIVFDNLNIQNFMNVINLGGNNSQVRNCVFENIGNLGTNRISIDDVRCGGFKAATSVIAPRSYNILLEHNLFTNIKNNYSFYRCVGLLHSIYATTAKNLSVIGNVFYDGLGGEVKFLNGVDNSLVFNNIFQKTGRVQENVPNSLDGQIGLSNDGLSLFWNYNNTIRNNFWWKPYATILFSNDHPELVGSQVYGNEVHLDSSVNTIISGNIQKEACSSSKPYTVLTKNGVNYLEGCCASQHQCIDTRMGTNCYDNNQLKDINNLCYIREWHGCTSANIGEETGDYNCTSSGWQKVFRGIQWVSSATASSEIFTTGGWDATASNVVGEPLGYNCHKSKSGVDWFKKTIAETATLTLSYERKVLPSYIEIYGQDLGIAKVEVQNSAGIWQVAWTGTTSDYCFNRIGLNNINYPVDKIKLTTVSGKWGAVAGVLLVGDESIIISPIIPACTESNWNNSTVPSVCPLNGKQIRTWTQIGICNLTKVGAVNHVTSEEISCTYNPNVLECINFTYSNWSECLQSEARTRQVNLSSPEGCLGGNPVLIETCNYTSPESVSPSPSSEGSSSSNSGGNGGSGGSSKGNSGTPINTPTTQPTLTNPSNPEIIVLNEPSEPGIVKQIFVKIVCRISNLFDEPAYEECTTEYL